MAPGPLDAVLDWLDQFRARRSLAVLLIAVNLGGVAYGFYYYGRQFGITPVWLWPWVPDSPLSTGFFAAALALHQLGRPSRMMDWLAFIANIKVGLWTGFALLHYDAYFGIFVDPLNNLNFWLFWLHLAMAVQAFVLARSLKPGWWSLAACSWFALDISMDYGLAPTVFAGCQGTKPITIPCQDVPLLVLVTIALTVLAIGLAILMAWRNRQRKAAEGAARTAG